MCGFECLISPERTPGKPISTRAWWYRPTHLKRMLSFVPAGIAIVPQRKASIRKAGRSSTRSRKRAATPPPGTLCLEGSSVRPVRILSTKRDWAPTDVAWSRRCKPFRNLVFTSISTSRASARIITSYRRPRRTPFGRLFSPRSRRRSPRAGSPILRRAVFMEQLTDSSNWSILIN